MGGRQEIPLRRCGSRCSAPLATSETMNHPNRPNVLRNGKGGAISNSRKIYLVTKIYRKEEAV